MRTRVKALTVTVAMVTAFAILPTFGAAAAEPLDDGSYDVVIGETTYTVDVVEGAPSVEGADGVVFTFAFDEATDRVLDEFDVTVDGVTYDVEVADDGTVTVTETEEPDEDAEGEDGEDDDAGDDDAGDEQDVAGDEDDEDDGEDDGDVEALDEGETDEVEDGGEHGALVSSVARCAPKGKGAREAGLPNHGVFVRAAAQGEQVEFEVDGQTHTADLSSQEGADAFCALADELLAAADAAGGEAAEDDGGNGNGHGNGKGRANAPGQLKKTD